MDGAVVANVSQDPGGVYMCLVQPYGPHVTHAITHRDMPCRIAAGLRIHATSHRTVAVAAADAVRTQFQVTCRTASERERERDRPRRLGTCTKTCATATDVLFVRAACDCFKPRECVHK